MSGAVLVATMPSRSPRGERGLKSAILDGVGDILTGSLPSRGAWVEMMHARSSSCSARGRSPRGERGLKCGRRARSRRSCPSLPSRGARVEIQVVLRRPDAIQSLPSRGARVEMSYIRYTRPPPSCRSPRGERGLKYRLQRHTLHAGVGRSPRGERGLKWRWEHPQTLR